MTVNLRTADAFSKNLIFGVYNNHSVEKSNPFDC